MKKTVLILGVNGAFGRYCASSFVAAGWVVKGFVRAPEKGVCELLKNLEIELLQGDVSDKTSIERAIEGVDVVVYGISPANYQWKGKAVPWLKNTIEVVQGRGLTFVFPDNIYGYHPEQGPLLHENLDMHTYAPFTEKGGMRQDMIRILQKATIKNTRVIVLRMGDFLAPDSPNSWWSILVKKGKKNYVLRLPGHAKHTWAYLPDVGLKVVALAQQALNRPAGFYNFHEPGYHLSWSEIALTLQKATGKPVKTKDFPWFLIRLLAIFSVLFRNILKMRYLWQQELYLTTQTPLLSEKRTSFLDVVKRLL